MRFLLVLLLLCLGVAWGQEVFVQRQKRDVAYHPEDGKNYRVADVVEGVPSSSEYRTRHYQVAVTLKGGEAAAKHTIEKHGFKYGGKIGGLPNRYKAYKDWNEVARPHMLHAEAEEFLEQEPLTRFIRRSGFWESETVQASRYPFQWNLHGYYGGYASQQLPNLNVQTAWARHGVTGARIIVGVVDDGVDKTNVGLAGKHVEQLQINIHEETPGRHGTEMAGIVVAEPDSDCNVGIAPHAGFVDIPLITDHMHTDADEATALSHGLCANDFAEECIRVFTCSWGPADNGMEAHRPGPLTSAAIALTASRGGIIVWAAGNGKLNFDNSNLDGYANHPDVVAVGAVNYMGSRASYSEPGANVFVVAPSNDYGVRGITSTAPGLHGCTDNASGTSAAAPQVAAIVALMLEKNRHLHTRDVQHILTLCSDVIDPFNRAEHRGIWIQNGAGFNFSTQYGFGLPDADFCLDLAGAWTPVPERHIEEMLVPTGHVFVPPTSTNTVSFDIYEEDIPQIRFLERVGVGIHMSCGTNAYDTPPPLARVGVYLKSPHGTAAMLLDTNSVLYLNDLTHSFTANSFWGEDPSGPRRTNVDAHYGTWELTIINHSRTCYVDLVDPVITFYGTHTSPINAAVHELRFGRART